MKKQYIAPKAETLNLHMESVMLSTSLTIDSGAEGGDQQLSNEKDFSWESDTNGEDFWQ